MRLDRILPGANHTLPNSGYCPIAEVTQRSPLGEGHLHRSPCRAGTHIPSTYRRMPVSTVGCGCGNGIYAPTHCRTGKQRVEMPPTGHGTNANADSAGYRVRLTWLEDRAVCRVGRLQLESEAARS